MMTRMMTAHLRRLVLGVLLGALGTTAAAGQQYQRPPQFPAPDGEVPLVVAVQSLLGLHGPSLRSELVEAGDEVVVRLTPVDLAAELAPVRARRTGGLEVRVRRDATGRVDRLTTSGTLPGRVATRVGAGAPALDRADALRGAKYGTRAALLARAREQAWSALGGRPEVQDATLVWQARDGGEEAVWQVRLQVTRGTAVVPFVVTIDPADGAVRGLVREDGR